MSYTINTLSGTQLKEIKALVEKSLKGDTNIKWSQKDGYNADNTFLPVKANKDLANYINTITGYSIADITSLHFIRYREGKNLVRHKDEFMLDIKNPVKSTSIVFLLSMSETGGEFLLNDKDVEFNTPGQYISFDGQATYHEVKEIKKGIREVLVLWYRPYTKKSLM